MATQLPAFQQHSPEMAKQAELIGLASKIEGLKKGLSASDGVDQTKSRAELREAAEGFEAMMISALIKEMMPEDQEGGLFGNGIGSKTYHQLFVTELSTLMAKTGQLGLADTIERDVADRVGLTEESQNRTDSIPGKVLGRPLPSIRRNIFSFKQTENSLKPELQGMKEKAIDHYRKQSGEFSFILPVMGTKSSSFGERTDPFTGVKRQHHGLDLAAAAGSNIKAAAPGNVVFSGWKRGYGNIVIIEHTNGFETRYAHNANNLVRKGDSVDAGQTVAKVGSTGRSTGPHLHFEIRKHGQPCDPEVLMNCAD